MSKISHFTGTVVGFGERVSIGLIETAEARSVEAVERTI